MDIGQVLLYIGLVCSIAALAFYCAANRFGRKLLVAARLSFVGISIVTVAAGARMMWLLGNHRFEFKAIYEHSSMSLKPPFLYAAAWAGQEGSFLLWTFWSVVLGLLLIWRAGKWESRVMPFFITALVALFTTLVKTSPFSLLTADNAPMGILPPTDGAGLNPSLQNYWMAIHPPIIFFGFVALSIPFAYAMAALWWRDHGDWPGRVLPWCLMSVATLGVGKMMGGYWAYETQGWHGYWAWDPVENASLFPWLAALALLHGLLIQKARGALARANMLLAVAGWVLFLYGSYLTRSGVLTDFSVHAFGASPDTHLAPLLLMIAMHSIGGIGLLIWRWKSVPARATSGAVISWDAAMVLAVTLMATAAVIVTVGTSWPLISRSSFIHAIPFLKSVSSEKGLAVEPIFYNKVGSVLLIPTLLVMGVVPFIGWQKVEAEKLLWKLMPAWFVAIACGFGVVHYVRTQAAAGLEVTTPPMLVVAIATLSLFAVFANLGFAFSTMRKSAMRAGGWIAHIGFALVFAGTIITNVYEQTVSFPLAVGMPPGKTPFGYQLDFAGWNHDGMTPEQIAKSWFSSEHAVRLRMTRTGSDGPGRIIEAPVFTTNMGGGQKTMRWPNIVKEWNRDFYVVVANDPMPVGPAVQVMPGATASIITSTGQDTGYKAKLIKLDTTMSKEGDEGGPSAMVVAQMELTTPRGERVPISPGVRVAQGGWETMGEEIPEIGGKATIPQGGIEAGSRAVTVVFDLPGAATEWSVPVSVTNKPAINLVWIGVVLMGMGAVWAMIRRAREAREIEAASAA